MKANQRKNSRFSVQDDVIAALKNGFTKIGKVKDISTGGLSFEHIENEISKHESFERNIILLVNGFCLPKVPCRVVYDIPVSTSDEYQAFPVLFITRRCGVKFERLSEDQKMELDRFIETYTQGNAP